MRRFSFLVLALITIVYIFSPKQESDTKPALSVSEMGAGADKELLARLEGDAGYAERASTEATTRPASAVDRRSARGPDRVVGATSVRPATLNTPNPTDVASTVPAIAPEPKADSALSSPSASSAEPRLAPLSEGDLAAAAQRELAKLGCYNAKVDGVWGRQSRAAVAAFNERIVGSWSDEPSRELISALRTAPAGLCKQTCSNDANGGQCTVSSTNSKTAANSAATDRRASYLPPWMRGEKAPAATTETVAVESGGTTTAASTANPPDRDTLRSPDYRRAERYSGERRWRRRRRSENWLPESWPRSAR